MDRAGARSLRAVERSGRDVGRDPSIAPREPSADRTIEGHGSRRLVGRTHRVQRSCR
jgi:hypothetical protein